MFVNLLYSFIQKFYHLWHSSLNAHLELDTHAESAWASLHVQLGHGPLHHQQPVPVRVPGGACLRRREKRAAARKKAEQVAKAAADSEASKKLEKNNCCCC